jgi:hypothetical protein
MENVIILAEDEMRRLKAEALIIESRIGKLQAFIETFNELSSSASHALRLPQAVGDGAEDALLDKRKTSQKSQVAHAVTSILADGQARSTRVLLSMLKSRGFAFSGSDEAQTLSIHLSTSGKFQSDRKLGWTLKNAEA